MQKPETLSVRLTPHTRQALDAEAGVRGVSGASVLARDILESWVAEQRSMRRRADVTRAVSYLLAWTVQSVKHARLKPTPSRISATELATIRAQVALCVGVVEPV